jgi:hypothetical protein
MKWNYWKTAVVGMACVALATSAIAAQQRRMYEPKTPRAYQSPASQMSMHSNAKKETVTLEIRGADCAKDAETLDAALVSHRITAKLQPSTLEPSRVTTSIDPNMDLGPVGQAVMKAGTQDRAKYPPSLDLVLFGKFDSATAKKATNALTRIKGVDARNSSANEMTGELNIRINGGAKVTAAEIHRALQQAGVWVQFARTNTARTS